jgi:serine/threonine-protein kinase HipA
MKKAKVFVNETLAGYLIEIEKGINYEFRYLDGYSGSSISLTMPTTQKIYSFNCFPIFFEGFLPEGVMLEGLLKKTKIDSDDLFEQLMRVGKELVGDVTVEREM